MLYNLKSGKTIQISFEQWLNMTEEDEEYLIATDTGSFRNNPISDSSFDFKQEETELTNQKEINELDELSPEEKLQDIDLDIDLLED